MACQDPSQRKAFSVWNFRTKIEIWSEFRMKGAFWVSKFRASFSPLPANLIRQHLCLLPSGCPLEIIFCSPASGIILQFASQNQISHENSLLPQHLKCCTFYKNMALFHFKDTFMHSISCLYSVFYSLK